MNHASSDSGLDLVTGAFSHIGSHIASRLLDQGRRVRTFTYHPDRQHALRDRVEAHAYAFDDPASLERSLEGVSTLYNTYWVRIERDGTTFDEAVRKSRILFDAAVRAGVRRIVHVSVSNPSPDSDLPYYSGKARVETELAGSGAAHSIVRPTLVYGSDREVLVNNIAYLLRKLPLFGVPSGLRRGAAAYRVQPVHVEDVARICVEQVAAAGDVTVDAAGPETFSFIEMVRRIREAVGAHSVVVPVPVPVMSFGALVVGAILKDVVLTREEADGLMQELLVTSTPPLGEIVFSEWLAGVAGSLGREYASELDRHFRG